MAVATPSGANAPVANAPTTPFIEGVLKAIGAPITANTTSAMAAWISAEGGPPDNPLNVMDNGAVKQYGSLEQGIQGTAATLNQSNMAVIKKSLTADQSAQNIKDATIKAPWNANHYANTTYGGEAAISYQQTNPPTTPAVSGPSFAPPKEGVDIKNFHGYDLSAFVGSNELGNAENAIETFTNPASKDANGLTLEERVGQDYSYSVGWALKHPDVGAVLIWAATQDPTSKTGDAMTMSFLQKTPWFQTTSDNQRAYEAAQSTDPAKAHQALMEAYDKTEATANQIGVTLTPKQAMAIAQYYAAQAYTPTGILGAVSGTSQEQLDQRVISAVTTIQKTGALPGVDTTATFNAGTIPTGAPTGQGIESQLFESLKGVAQQYMMYSSSPSSPLTDADLQKYVASYMQEYTGSGSYGSSNLQQGAIQAFTALMQQQAASLYPTMAAPIKMGTTPQTYTAPISNLITSTMGLTQGSVDLTTPKWNWAISNDPTTGAPLTQDAILQKLTTLPEYQQTDNAKNTAHSVINGLSQMLGTGGA